MKKPKIDPEIKARIEDAAGPSFRRGFTRLKTDEALARIEQMTDEEALDWIEKQSGPDKMSKKEAYDFYQGIKDGLAIRMEALCDEMEDEEG